MSNNGPPPAELIKKNVCGESNFTSEQQILVAISETKLLDLNDDCLVAILSHLDVINLCSIGRVCKRLKELAQSHFSSKYKTLHFSTLFKFHLISNQEARNIFLNFGPVITSMVVERKSFQDHGTVGYVEENLLKDIAVCCVRTLQSLVLKNFHFTQSAVESLNMLSDSLKSLSLDGSVMTDHCVLHLTNFASLKNLTISNTRDCSALMESYPALRHLTLHKLSITCQSILQHFIVRHRRLESLKIRSATRISSELVPVIANYTKSLNIIYLCFGNGPFEMTQEFQHNILFLSKIKTLQRLRLKCDYRSIGNLLTKMTTNQILITHLQLSKGIVDCETIEAIMQMKDLVQIGFNKMIGLTNEHLIKLATELQKLKILHILSEPNITTSALKEVLRLGKQLTDLTIDKFCLDLKLYNDILDIVKERRNGILKITILSSDEQVFVPQETIRLNENWILLSWKRQ